MKEFPTRSEREFFFLILFLFFPFLRICLLSCLGFLRQCDSPLQVGTGERGGDFFWKLGFKLYFILYCNAYYCITDRQTDKQGYRVRYR